MILTADADGVAIPSLNASTNVCIVRVPVFEFACVQRVLINFSSVSLSTQKNRPAQHTLVRKLKTTAFRFQFLLLHLNSTVQCSGNRFVPI